MVVRVVAARVKRNAYFLAGMGLGLALALLAAPLDEEPEPCAPSPLPQAPPDDWEPHREERPPVAPPGQPPSRALQRPRYYSTELGIRAPLLAAVLSTEDALGSRVAALNVTLRRLPALRYFMAASALRGPAAGLPGVVGFTDSREMLRPFHALKYLADNHLDDYDFFFLVGDSSFVDVRRLTGLAARLSVSRDVYMGELADGDGHYCTLEGGILLSNSVLRAVHSQLDWCVRNSYSPHHHENIGRCVLHAAHVSCQQRLQGESYEVGGEGEAGPGLATAVAAHPAIEPAHLHRLHAYTARLHLDAAAEEIDALRGRLARLRRKHPPGARNASWPAGLRGDAGLPPPPPASRFDLLRWTRCNGTHALLPDDHRSVAPLSRDSAEALALVVEAARAWALTRWPDAFSAELGEAAWRWEPAAALRYRLLLRLRSTAPPDGQPSHVVRQVEVARVLGAARLVPVPYVTESARVVLLLPVPAAAASDARGFLRRYDLACLRRNANVALLVVLLGSGPADEEALRSVESAALALSSQHPGAQLDVVRAPAPTEPDASLSAAALSAAKAIPRDALVLLAVAHMDFNEDFLNRVRMNTISGTQWYLAAGFARHAASSVAPPEEGKPRHNTGRFNLRHTDVLAFYRRDYDAALVAWQSSGRPALAPVASVLASGPLHCLRAPEPALLLAPRGPVCGLLTGTMDTECLRQLRDDEFRSLELGAAHALAKMALQAQSA